MIGSPVRGLPDRPGSPEIRDAAVEAREDHASATVDDREGAATAADSVAAAGAPAETAEWQAAAPTSAPTDTTEWQTAAAGDHPGAAPADVHGGESAADDVPAWRVDGRIARGDRTRAAVLETAVALATEAGLDGLSLGQLANRLGVSKSGLFSHWRSKEVLQLATIEWAREDFAEFVIRPALRAPKGVRRLWTLHEARLGYACSPDLPGGCFFTNAQFEYDARTGPVRDRLVEVFLEWLSLLERFAFEAVTNGELFPYTDPAALAFEINAFGTAAVYQSRLMPDADVVAMSRRAALSRLRALCTDPGLLPEA
jgi:AcrR family transcriptional regulator